jgi:ribosomal protein L7Ae-like RNA K-turn-binding protein
VETARAKNMFAHAFRAPAKPPADLVPRIERLLAERCIALIGFARRADQIFVGRDQVKAAISAGQVALLVAAADSEGRDATDLAARFGGERFSVLTSAELGAALGREGIVHMGVKPGRLAETLARELRRLHGFRVAEATAAPTARGRRH